MFSKKRTHAALRHPFRVLFLKYDDPHMIFVILYFPQVSYFYYHSLYAHMTSAYFVTFIKFLKLLIMDLEIETGPKTLVKIYLAYQYFQVMVASKILFNIKRLIMYVN